MIDWFIVIVSTGEIILDMSFNNLVEISSTPQLDLGARSLITSVTDLLSIV